MPLVHSYWLSGGLFVEGDCLSLSPHLLVRDHKLQDSITLSAHELSEKALRLVARLRRGTTFSSFRKYANQLSIPDAEFAEFLVAMHSIGGIRVNRGLKTNCIWLACAIQGMRFGTFPPARLIVAPASVISLGVGILFSLKWLILICPLAVVLLYGFGYALSTALILKMFFLLLLWLSTVAHELVHLLLVRDRSRVLFLRRGLRIGILHQQESGHREALSALAGPFAGFLVCSMTTAIPGITPYSTEMQFIAWSCGFFHLLSLWPAYGDGQAVMKHLRRAKNETN